MTLFVVTFLVAIKIVATILAGLLFGTAIYVSKHWDTIWGKDICVLGLPQTGKTLFLNGLQGNYEIFRDLQNGIKPNQTNVEKIKSFTIKDSNGNKVLKIRETKDIGGTENFVLHYDALIKKSDFIIYCCNIDSYLKNEKEALEVRARLQLVYTLMKKHNKLKPEDEKSNIMIILSYSDLVSNRRDAMIEFCTSIGNEDYSIFTKSICPVNMTDTDEVKKLIKGLLREIK